MKKGIILFVILILILPLLVWVALQKNIIGKKAAERVPSSNINTTDLRTPEAEITPFEKLDQSKVPEVLKEIDQKFDIKGIKSLSK